MASIFWNAMTGVHLDTLGEETSGVKSVAFSPDGTTLVSGHSDNIRFMGCRDGNVPAAAARAYG